MFWIPSLYNSVIIKKGGINHKIALDSKAFLLLTIKENNYEKE